MVMPGAKLDGASLYELIETENVTLSAAVPTVWLTMLEYLEKEPGRRLPSLERVVIGGSACPEAMMKAFEETTAST
jgi:acyl-CoA synthetase (AMP-forming)/AMP-acid ligase II